MPLTNCLPDRFEISVAPDGAILVTADLPQTLPARSRIKGIAINPALGAAIIGLERPEGSILLAGLSVAEVEALAGMTACRIVLCGPGMTPPLQIDLPLSPAA